MIVIPLNKAARRRNPVFRTDGICDGRDPAFAALERAKTTWAEFLAAFEEQDRQREADTPAPGDYRSAHMVTAAKESISAREDLATTVPAAPGGILAVVSYVADRSRNAGEFYFLRMKSGPHSLRACALRWSG